MRRDLIAILALVAIGAPATGAETFVECDVKLDLPGGRLEARIYGDGKSFNDLGEAALVVPVAGAALVTDTATFDLADPAGRTAEYRIFLKYDLDSDPPPPAWNRAGARHPWWPSGELFTGPPLPAGPDPDKDLTYAVFGSGGTRVKTENWIYMTGSKSPHRASVGLEYQRSDSAAEHAANVATRIAFLKALSADETFAIAFVRRNGSWLGVAYVDTRLLKAAPDLSDLAYEEAARMQKAGRCRVTKS